MEELIEKLENLKNELNDTAEVVRVKDLNLKIKDAHELQTKLSEYKRTNSEKLKKEIYTDNLYQEYKEAETDLNILIMQINKSLRKVNSKGKCGL